MAHNIPLNILDEYAKTITSKQANMLYEHANNKKYQKKLLEGKEYQSSKNCEIFLTEFMINEAKTTIGEVIDRYVNKYGLQYNVFNNSIHLYSPLIENYTALLKDLVNNGFRKDLLATMVKTNAEKEMIKKL